MEPTDQMNPRAGLHSDEVLDRRHEKLTRRTVLSVLAGGISAMVVVPPVRPVIGSTNTLAQLEERLVLNIEHYERWDEEWTSLDSSIPPQLLDRVVPHDEAAKAELAEWCRSNAIDFAENQANLAWERRTAIEQEIAALTPVDMRGLMVQAQVLTTRHQIRSEDRLIDSFIQGLKDLRPANECPSASDNELLSACHDWNSAIDEVEASNSAVDKIHLPGWAKRYPQFVSDPVRKAMIEAEHRHTGYRAALERLGAARDRLEMVEFAVAFTTATTFTALLTQASPIARKLAQADGYAYVSGRIGMALVRGLERLGGRRTRNLHHWWGTEADDPPIPNIDWEIPYPVRPKGRAIVMGNSTTAPERPPVRAADVPGTACATGVGA